MTRSLAFRARPATALLVLAATLACSSGSGELQPEPRPTLGPGSSGGGSGLDPCPSGEPRCGGVCCGSLYECVDGACVCSSPFVLCSETCVDVQTDANHCGACDVECDPGQSCVQGTCAGGSGCDDPCPVADGIQWGCSSRFMYGANYAWHSFAADFGGISAWGQDGVAGNPEVAVDLAELAAGGVSTVRWWVFPSFRGDGVRFDADGTPVGLGGTALADLERALELADENELYLMLCLFSFDNFEPSGSGSGLWVPGLHPIATDAAKRAALVEQVVRPFARAAEQSPHRDHLIAWDVINEPEGAMHGPSKYGDPSFPAWGDLETLSHDEMEVFVGDVIAGLRQESSALITIGGLEMDYRRSWSQTDVDFYQVHNYGSWSYARSPADWGITDKPVVLGEMPWSGLGGESYAEVLATLYGNGYAGALVWQYNEHRGQLGEVAAFASEHPCETRY